jgi:hypothetical protein
LCLWCNVCHSTAFQEHIGIFQRKINGNPVYGLTCNFTCKIGTGNIFGRAVACLSIRRLEIFLWESWWEMLSVPSLIVWAYKNTKITEISIFVPCKTLDLIIQGYCCICFCYCYCCVLLLHIILKDYLAMSVTEREFRWNENCKNN